jgi:hypothetical protein
VDSIGVPRRASKIERSKLPALRKAATPLQMLVESFTAANYQILKAAGIERRLLIP